MSSPRPSIPEFYRGRKILITGGSGFMGKVLIEKLLRSCPDVHTLYLLLRAKKQKEPSSRIKEITDQPLFDRIRQDSPGQLDKLVAVSGDITELGLGLSGPDRRMLQLEVSVIFHSAASVRFDDPIRDAVITNVRGTREVVDLATGMTNLKVLLHVSTAYSNCDRPEVLEQMYPAPGDWRSMIQVVERSEHEELLNCLTPKIIGTLPNTYTYAKALGEHVIKDYSHQLPVVIVRPSIVVASNEEPMPGWVDNLYGPFVLCVAQGKGLTTSVYSDPDTICDFVPVDVAIKAMIFIAVHRASCGNEDKLPIFNSCDMVPKLTNMKLSIRTQELVTGELTFDDALWYPTATLTTCWWNYYLQTILFQLIPAILLDAVLKMKGRKPMMQKLQRRMFMAIQSLVFFSFQSKKFVNDNFIRLNDEMQDSDLKDFAYNKQKLSEKQTIDINVKGVKVFVMKEPITSVPKAQAHIRRLYWLHQVTRALFYMLMLWALSSCYSVRATFLTASEWITFNTVQDIA